MILPSLCHRHVKLLSLEVSKFPLHIKYFHHVLAWMTLPGTVAEGQNSGFPYISSN